MLQLGARPLPSAPALEECRGWLNGTLDTWSDPSETKRHNSAKGGFTSQYGQDRILWNAVFRHLGRPGVYADVASNHYKRISNTYFLDVCAGWHGLCVEPNAIYWADTLRFRSCKLVQTCASAATGPQELTLPNCRRCSWLGGLGGIRNGSLMDLSLIHI